MQNNFKIFYSLLLGIHFLFFQNNFVFSQGVVKVENLKCEYLSAPNNIDTYNPRFSWTLRSNENGQLQTAYQIIVFTQKDKIEIWNSGKIDSPQNTQLYYSGKKLKNNSKYFWFVKVWDKSSKEFVSDTTEFWTSLLEPTLWKAKWIGENSKKEYFPETGFFQDPKEQYKLPDTVIHNGRSLLLRNDLFIKDKIKTARVFITGLGYYEFYINGNRIGDHYLSPAKTNYRKEILYDTYDVANELQKGKNSFGIHLGNGWFNPYKKWWQPYRMQWFGAKRAIMQLVIEYENGSEEIFTTNEDWKYADGPVTYNCIYDGEIYDSNLEIKDWNKTSFDDSHWNNVKVLQSPGGELKSHTMPAIKVMHKLLPIKKNVIDDKKIVYDFGQNFAGWVKIEIKGKKNSQIKLQFAEDIFTDVNIDITSNENAKAQYVIKLNSDTIQIFQPRFTFFGFKYVEVSSDSDFEVRNIEGQVLHTAVENTGRFECSNEILNKIHRATVWSQKSNILGYPSDCPQRDERLGWFGDAQVTIEEALYNFDMPQFYMNWLNGIRLNQNSDGDIPIISPRPYIWDEGVEWSSTYLILVWKYYKYFGDEEILKIHYPAMKKYFEFLNSIADNFIIKKGWIGDWGSLVNGWKEGEPESVPTAFYYWNAVILSEIAEKLNFIEDQKYFIDAVEKIKKTFNEKFYHKETKNYNDGSQMANSFPLYLGLAPEHDKITILDNLIKDIVEKNKGHLTTGVLGSKYMIDVLAQNGKEDIAYLLATQTGYPSWSDMVEKYTTMCEFWTLKQSHNHVMTGSIDAFFYKTLAGINFSENSIGCGNILIKPYFADNLNFVNASVETINGAISVNWIKSVDSIKLTVQIPINSSAEVLLSKKIMDNNFGINQISNDNKNIEIITENKDLIIFQINSGKYEFSLVSK